MVTVGAREAQAHWATLLDRVADGERVVITRRGVPVAELSPVSRFDAAQANDLAAWFRAFRATHRAGGEVREWIEEGRE
jgi:prevent-host-death family protein